MSGSVVTVRETDSLETVLNILDARGFSGLPVTNAEQKLVGLVSRTDITNYALAHSDKSVQIIELMTPFIFTINPEDTVKKVVDTMVKAGIHRIVVTESGRPVGIITSMDLVKEYGRSLDA
ncbi:MAG: CBS domain-containing protein [Candidatus Eremiobacteraeota bacterium]|nr:CBS domain-containing protein [Candidatus Eremiobacteraeota bacterium]